MTPSTDLIERRRRAVPQGVGMFAGETTVSKASGAHLTTADGELMIDLAGGIGVVNAGHCPEPVVRAIQKQAELLLHTCIHVATYEPYVALCEKLNTLLPHGEATKTLLLNSGAEAIENAIKIARQATGRPAIMCYTGAFHGRTMMGMSLTSKTAYKIGCGPFAPEVYRLPFPDSFHDGSRLSDAEFSRRELERLEQAFDLYVSEQKVAAIIMEVVQGESGFLPVPVPYLQGLRKICTQHGILLILDEIQSGFCRTGRWAAYEHYDVVPDISTWAKSLGSGMPISAVVGRADVMDAALPGTLGGTYGGNPVACAAALATINLMEELNLNERGAVIGEIIRKRFEALKDKTTVIGEVRGLGAMIAVEFCYHRNPTRPAGEVVAKALARCRDRGVLVLPAGPHKSVMRVLSPLVIEDNDLDKALTIIEESVLEAAQEVAA